MVDDGVWYAPSARKPPARQARAGEVVWEVSRAPNVHSCELRDHGGFGVEAQILRDGELVIGKRFDTRAQALHWADLVRGDLEKGSV